MHTKEVCRKLPAGVGAVRCTRFLLTSFPWRSYHLAMLSLPVFMDVRLEIKLVYTGFLVRCVRPSRPLWPCHTLHAFSTHQNTGSYSCVYVRDTPQSSVVGPYRFACCAALESRSFNNDSSIDVACHKTPLAETESVSFCDAAAWHMSCIILARTFCARSLLLSQKRRALWKPTVLAMHTLRQIERIILIPPRFYYIRKSGKTAENSSRGEHCADTAGWLPEMHLSHGERK